MCEAGRVFFWCIGFDLRYKFAPKLKKYYVGMIIPALTGLLVVGILTAFFYKSVKMDIAGAIITAVISAGILALLITGAIYAGQVLG